MSSIPVVVKHQGKRYNVDLDPTSTGETFKFQLYSLTGVEPERQKILVKGGQLKDDTDLSKIGAKPGAAFMMMGTPSQEGLAALERPKEQIKFLEDMTEAEVAQSEGAVPAGLQNLGNTCYMNSTLQTLRAIPELQDTLSSYSPAANSSSNIANLSQFGLGGLGSSGSDLTESLRDLFKQMSETQEGFPPLIFLNSLRQAFPQFAQKARDGNGYAQQDAEEAWSQIVSQLRQKLKFREAATEEGTAAKEVSFVDYFMAGKFDSVMECDEPEAKEKGEEPVKSTDTFFKLNCHIGPETNHLGDGLTAGLKEQIEKTSQALGREAAYTKTSHISRLPKYLPVHFMRFDWKRTAGKKAKIMRKVTFPHELDVIEYCTDGLKKQLIPIRDKIRDIRKEEEDVERAKKRQKRLRNGEENDAGDNSATKGKSDAKTKEEAKKPSKDGVKIDGDTEMAEAEYKTDAQIEEERAASILFGKKELLSLVDPSLAADKDANQTGLYELRGVITHQGANADSGHYTSYVKKQARVNPSTGKKGEEDGKWWWFNDEKVSEVDAEKIETLAGGGQSHSALILLYRSVPLPTIEEK